MQIKKKDKTKKTPYDLLKEEVVALKAKVDKQDLDIADLKAKVPK